MFAIHEYIGAIIVDENIHPALAIFLQSEVGRSSEKIREIEEIIANVVASGKTFSFSGNATAVYIGPQHSRLELMVGDRQELEFPTDELLRYVVLWRDFLEGAGR